MKGKPKKQKERQQPSNLPRPNIKRPTGAAEFSLRNKGGMPNMPIKKQMTGNYGGSQPPMRPGGSKLPMGNMPPNFMGSKFPPTMGQQSMNIPSMGQQPPVMGGPPMGQGVPPMGQVVPPMRQGVPPMGQGVPMGQPMRPPQGMVPMGQNNPQMGQQIMTIPPMGQQPKPKPV